jgi:hypothetical protein
MNESERVIARDGWKVCGATTATGRGCQKLKPLADFHASGRTSDGRKPVCAACCNAEAKQRAERNPERVRAQKRASRLARYWRDPEKAREEARRAFRDRYARDPEPIRERNRLARRRRRRRAG